eukprot:COSAG05_NODE_2617_length_2832_cov_3.361142_3_plen_143_part_00
MLLTLDVYNTHSHQASTFLSVSLSVALFCLLFSSPAPFFPALPRCCRECVQQLEGWVAICKCRLLLRGSWNVQQGVALNNVRVIYLTVSAVAVRQWFLKTSEGFLPVEVESGLTTASGTPAGTLSDTRFRSNVYRCLVSVRS